MRDSSNELLARYCSNLMLELGLDCVEESLVSARTR
jgi:hypothetical protein